MGSSTSSGRLGCDVRARPIRFLVAAAAVTTLATLSGCAWSTVPGQAEKETSSPSSIYPAETVRALLEDVPHRTVTALPAARLAEDLIPPTNRWFSGLVFGEPSMPVFPLPLSFQLTDDGISFGLPAISTAPAAIMGGFMGAISADLGADEHEVVAYDTASVTISQRSGGKEIGRTVIAQGSPLVTFTASRDTTVRMGQSFAPADEVGVGSVAVDGAEYGVRAGEPLEKNGTTIELPDGHSVTWFVVQADGNPDDLIAAAHNPVTGTSLSYAVDDERATTSISYQTEKSTETLVAAMPHQASTETDCSLGTYPSIYGDLQLCRTESLRWTVPTLDSSGSVDLAGLDSAARKQLLAQLEIDVETTPAFPTDTYFGGKALYRAANLLDVARQLDAADLVSALEARLTAEISKWMEPDGCTLRSTQCFVYDDAARGMVGLEPSFGSDEFNDHHFHYGYFLYAAGVVAAGNDELVSAWAPVLNLVAADLATSGASSYFPERRVFDAYAGHSWASGTSPFGDGNNQESSSEAVTAWNGLALWAKASGQSRLFEEAKWMLSAEAASARAYWTDFPLGSAVYDGFGHTITSIVWGGKRDYATWFSAEPSAMLGILVLPMSPVSGYLAGDPERIRANVRDAAPKGFDVMFGDYLLMYSALAGTEAATDAVALATALPDARIDDGNSRTYMLAWLWSLSFA